ncbi:MAG: hypothetical protein ABJF65_00125 [Reichenbachiella sp.]|uniref:hypothetical protein n=1 Tax=Reichenbachiella sp. TaxID=2184521 RepID=UPI00326421FC
MMENSPDKIIVEHLLKKSRHRLIKIHIIKKQGITQNDWFTTHQLTLADLILTYDDIVAGNIRQIAKGTAAVVKSILNKYPELVPKHLLLNLERITIKELDKERTELFGFACYIRTNLAIHVPYYWRSGPFYHKLELHYETQLDTSLERFNSSATYILPYGHYSIQSDLSKGLRRKRTFNKRWWKSHIRITQKEYQHAESIVQSIILNS